MTNPIINDFGTQIWMINGDYHRTDGPAIIYASGARRWYVKGEFCWSPKAFQQAAKLSDEEMTFLLLKYKFK